jgi:hypothetical protein
MNFIKKSSSSSPTRNSLKSKRVRQDLEPWMKSILSKWIETHADNPYPSEKEKLNLSIRLGMTKKQISVWFINMRRVSAPMKSAIHFITLKFGC